MNDLERKFLLAVERGDIKTIKTILNVDRSRLNIDCCDPLARNALVIAIDNQNLDIIKLMIEARIGIGDAILHAIDENFVEAVELLLDYELASLEPGQPYSWERVSEQSFYGADISPLMLAAHRNNFEVIKILLDRRVAPVPDPHDPRCDCSACCKARSEDCLKHSRFRINAYKALASPCLMALSSPDPLLTAFKLSARLENLATLEPEYKEDYLGLRAKCQTFAAKLLDHARTSEELEVLLNYSDDLVEGPEPNDDVHQIYPYSNLHELSSINVNSSWTSFDLCPRDEVDKNSRALVVNSQLACSAAELCPLRKKESVISLDSVTGQRELYRSHARLARLRLAIECKQKSFCAHPNIQELLAAMWYENLPGFRQKGVVAQLFQIILIGLMFPVYSMAYLVAPDTRIGRYIKRPFIKFICHSASYITFLTVLILASQRVEAFYSWDSVISLFVQTKNLTQVDAFFGRATLIKQVATPGQVPDTTTINSSDVKQLFNMYKNRGQTGASARGLESLTKVFEEVPSSSKKRGALPSPIELVILLWVVSLLWSEIKQLRTLGMNYYKSDMWNTLDSVASGFYIGTIILRTVSFIQTCESSADEAREHWHAYDPILLSEGLFAAGTIFSALKLVYIFSVNPYLGPLQISLGRMIIDIIRFSWIYILVLFSFACGMNQLLWYYADLEHHHCLNITNYNLAQYYSNQQQHPNMIVDPHQEDTNQSVPSAIDEIEHNSTEHIFMASFDDDSSKLPVTIDESCKTWRYFSNVFESTQTLFWATFGLVDLDNFDLAGIRQYTRFWALLMFGCYCFINVVVVMNLLIAVMNHSYVKIGQRSDVEWKFARTRLWMSYFDTGSTVPAPFNIIPSLKSLVLFFARVARRIREPCSGPQVKTARLDVSQRNHLAMSYQNVVRSLVRRYLVNEQRLVERKLTEAKLNRWAKREEETDQSKRKPARHRSAKVRRALSLRRHSQSRMKL